jgi:protein-L-isoaspartate(D-aspartate) O-methyltransferase
LVAPVQSGVSTQAQSGVSTQAQSGVSTQALMVIDRTAQGLRQTVLEPVHFVPLKSGIA